jgi:LAO/AO transport system kinase
MSNTDANTFYKAIQNGDTKALAKAITYLESTLQEHQVIANQLLDLCVKETTNTIRIGVTGVPGAGKSTFIDAFGTYLIETHNKKVAVLAIDPSSQRSKGSILGDKTRMNRLSVSEHAFVRPSPSGDNLGGVAAQTRESILLCEAAGYDVVLVETVGVGQSETLVHEMVDFFLLLLLPGAGDELQGIKRGIVEMADMIAINKTETNEKLAKEASLHYKNALHLLTGARNDWEVPVANIDSLSGLNLPVIYTQVEAFLTGQKANGNFESTRKNQSSIWLKQHIGSIFDNYIKTNSTVGEKLDSLQALVQQNKLSARSAATQFINDIIKI